MRVCVRACGCTSDKWSDSRQQQQETGVAHNSTTEKTLHGKVYTRREHAGLLVLRKNECVCVRGKRGPTSPKTKNSESAHYNTRAKKGHGKRCSTRQQVARTLLGARVCACSAGRSRVNKKEKETELTRECGAPRPSLSVSVSIPAVSFSLSPYASKRSRGSLQVRRFVGNFARMPPASCGLLLHPRQGVQSIWRAELTFFGTIGWPGCRQERHFQLSLSAFYLFSGLHTRRGILYAPHEKICAIT